VQKTPVGASFFFGAGVVGWERAIAVGGEGCEEIALRDEGGEERLVGSVELDRVQGDKEGGEHSSHYAFPRYSNVGPCGCH
jgi:hypothetical protein